MRVFNKNKFVSIVVILLLVCIPIFVFTLKKQTTSTNTIDNIPKATLTPVVAKPTPFKAPEGWETYTNTQFTFMHPAEVNLNENTTQNNQLSELVKLSFMGEKQIQSGRTQTELADGYIFIVSKLKESKNTPLTISEERYKNTLEGCLNIPNSVVSKVEKINLQNISGYTYNVNNCRGSYILNFVSNNNDNYEITLFFTGFNMNDEMGYKKTVEKILQTFKFIN